MGETERDIQKEEMKNLISRNVSVTVPAKIFYLATRVFLPPLILAHISLEAYGIWACCFIIISYMGMSVFGIASVYVRYVADFSARGEQRRINQLLSTGIVISVAASMVLLTALWFLLPWIIRLFHITPTMRETAFVLFFGTAVVFLFDLSLGSFAFVLNGLQQFTQQNIVWILSYCVEAGLIVAFLLGGMGVYGLLTAFAVRYGLSTVAYVWLCYRALPGLSVRLRNFDRGMLRLFYGYGAIVQISGLMGIFLRSIEKVLAGVYINVKTTGVYDVGEKLPIMATSIPSALNAVFLPAMSHMHSLGREEEVAKLYLKGTRYLSMMTGLIMGFIAAFSTPVILGWMGPGAKEEVLKYSPIILTFFALPFQMNVLTGPASAFFRGIGRPTRELVYPVVQLVFVVAAVAVGFHYWGRTVMVINWTVASSMVLSALVYMIYSNRFMGVRQLRFFVLAIAPGLAPYLIGWLTALLANNLFEWWEMDRWLLLGALGVSGVVYTLVTALVLYFLFCNWGERQYLRLQSIHTLKGLLSRRRRGSDDPNPREEP